MIGQTQIFFLPHFRYSPYGLDVQFFAVVYHQFCYGFQIAWNIFSLPKPYEVLKI